MQISSSSPRAVFAQFQHQRNTAATTGGSNIASEASYWCNRCETSEIQAALYAHAQYNTHVQCMVHMEGFALQCFHCLVCVSVCPSVPALAASASVETSKQRYSRVSLGLKPHLVLSKGPFPPHYASYIHLISGLSNLVFNFRHLIEICHHTH